MRNIRFLPKFGSIDHSMKPYKIATVYELHAFELVKLYLSSKAGRHPSTFYAPSSAWPPKVYELRISTGVKAVLPHTKSKAGKLCLIWNTIAVHKTFILEGAPITK